MKSLKIIRFLPRDELVMELESEDYKPVRIEILFQEKHTGEGRVNIWIVGEIQHWVELHE